jgi:hypothetical protein
MNQAAFTHPPSFIQNYHSIDREAMRLYILQTLTELRSKAETVIFAPEHQPFWDSLHNAIGATQNEPQQQKLRRVEEQLRGIIHFIDEWKHTAVDTSERLDLFVRIKAAELLTGDQDKDYYWAMRIRHDQLVALCRVLTLLLDQIASWVTQAPLAVLEDAVFLGLTQYSLEQQVYLEAQQVHKERQRLEGHERT